tara:strand:+ start:2811 stop:3566 length:756 start_codon:yes stop_codon:yes gene_type:complete
MNNLDFDIVICVGPNDNDIIEHMLPYTKKNVVGYRNIYLVCADSSIKIDGTITIDENIFPFTMKDLNEKFGKNNRNGWYLQQLLKFYAGNIIPGILSKYLIIDCDTHFLKPTKFISDEGKYIYTTGDEYHKPYFVHMNKLDKTLHKAYPLSGISHHTFFDTNIINEFFKKIENNFNNELPFWRIYLNMIDMNEFAGSGSAENETYFTYMYLYHNDKMIIRQLNWINSSILKPDYETMYDFVSVHWYMRKTK